MRVVQPVNGTGTEPERIGALVIVGVVIGCAPAGLRLPDEAEVDHVGKTRTLDISMSARDNLKTPQKGQISSRQTR